MVIDREVCSMMNAGTTCQGERSSLICCSLRPLCPTRPYKLFWQLRHRGLRQAFRVTLLRIRRAITTRAGSRSRQQSNAQPREALDLKPGELVRVRPEPEILATLDKCDQHRGLAWMPTMRGCCGKEFRVYKRVGKIVLESTGEIRKLKNTVMLESAICDGIYGCDRSCFFFWKEAWLERMAQCASDQ
jgi:hypothetical protein